MTDPLFQIKNDRRERALDVMRAALIGEDADAFLELSPVFSRHLTESELMMLSWAMLNALPSDKAADVVHNMVSPVGTISQTEDYSFGAGLWARDACVSEIKAYTFAAFKALPPRDRIKLKDWVGRKV